ncbi:MAG: uridine kinase [Acholeplasmatales bacterium]|jgi:uridine kinase|nr:uridine kinase [Acholeplasmataceae bacterium]MCK9428001.1 uridine kinase [Acholeplasmataceae bacterium]MDD4090816.1 uridine kinase [Acholeplasmataceae bacterium]MDY0115781.1 uridine kinase [Acholeplasmatales bacterium]HHT39284.1 uridine kinase [Acholeplasmataceae bacterium]
MKPVIIAVGGGSASGKTTVVLEILEKLNEDEVLIIEHDDYYKDQTHLKLEERYLINYDHPDSLDNELLIKDLTDLIAGKTVSKPLYDFLKYTRSKKKEIIKPKKVIVLEGILILTDKKLRELADIKLFVELDDDLRFIRRLERDISERGRTVENVINQYLLTVKPMYHQFVEPSKRYADIIIPNNTKHDVAVDIIVAKINDILGAEK